VRPLTDLRKGKLHVVDSLNSQHANFDGLFLTRRAERGERFLNRWGWPTHQEYGALTDLGASCISSSNRFSIRSTVKNERPVMLPSGRRRFFTSPEATMSPDTVTIGRSFVACFAGVRPCANRMITAD